jgi:hypothetical protein
VKLPGRETNPSMRRRALVAFTGVIVALVAATTAFAHIERASYWPDPAPEKVGSQTTGGKVPKTRSLFSALNKKEPGKTRVVCQGKSSIKRLVKSVKVAEKRGWRLRPSEPRIHVSEKKGDRVIEFNLRLLEHCAYDSIQTAVNRSGNNDRVVIMPGVYTEPDSRSQPTPDHRCDSLRQTNDKSNPNALSYRYQFSCPNDQNLIAVMGREPGTGSDPQPPRQDRHVIPNSGACIRCNLQMEGSGIRPDDVVVDAGRVESGNSGPIGAVKDVGIRADRADGFVLRNMNLRHAREHGIYVLEVDGYRLERFRTPYNGEYGVLTFVADHGLMQNCDAYGSGDAGLYPGAAPDSGEQRNGGPYRYNTEIRNCDMHHNSLGYSGTDGNAVWVHHNDFYDNAEGFSTDVFTAAGHPGFPQDSDLIEHNQFYSNNFNPYEAGSDVDPSVPVPVGTGMWIAGGNNNTIRRNQFWDNWRRGAMLFSVPDQFACDDPGNQIDGCSAGQYHTSYRNRYYENSMGRAPKTKKHKAHADPNGEDFWWDQGGIQPPDPNTGNCWFNNTGPDGTAASVTSIPSGPPALPSDCAHSFAPGAGTPTVQLGELLVCLADMSPGGPCVWFKTPPEPQP